ncbi:PREDICTED: AT-rich interactive domain-containing protein 2-like [Branchiostoma belcheri]|uniref:AT-rich interactive domain-containing protein 2-like n=1 Tax=Branchiostoma belcheri TaxID=7741 RepID=A0A6P4XVW4_BRABE|nr:PREDICTED: AT-rich interactive domain-containing protein 2-like [Branchiostoma belcheri]
MDRSPGKDPGRERRQKQAFLKDLKDFHAAKGHQISRFPYVGGRELDLHHLYNKVTSLGGFQKVSEKERWGELTEHFHFPRGCTHAPYALKQLYLRYLEPYERVNQGEEEEDFLLDRSPSASPRPGTPMGMGYHGVSRQVEIPDALRQTSGLSLDKPALTDYDKLMMSLQSGLPNEVDFAINVCTLLSNESKHVMHLNKAPRIIDQLLAQVGLFEDGPGSYQSVYEEGWKPLTGRDFVKFWKDTVEDGEMKDLIRTPLDKTTDEDHMDLDSLFNTRRNLGINDIEGQRVLQVAVILRNLSFEADNVSVLASHKTCFRFLLLCAHSKYASLKQLGLDTLSNVAVEMILEPVQNETTQLLMHTICACLNSRDKFSAMRGMEVLGKLCQVPENQEVLEECVELDTYRNLVRTLLVHDVQVLLACLEVLYDLSNVGKVTASKIASIEHSVEILVGMLTLDVQTLRPDALAGIRIIDHGPHRHAAQDPNRMDSYHQAQQTGQRQQMVSATVSSSHPAAPSQGERREIDSETFTCQWLNSLYEVDSEGSVARIDLYADYLSSCSKLARVGILTSTHFYRCVKTLFPNTGSKRVDTNGQVVYHIGGIKKRAVPLHINYSLLQAKAQAASPTVQILSRSKSNPPVGASPPPQGMTPASSQHSSQVTRSFTIQRPPTSQSPYPNTPTPPSHTPTPPPSQPTPPQAPSPSAQPQPQAAKPNTVPPPVNPDFQRRRGSLGMTPEEMARLIAAQGQPPGQSSGQSSAPHQGQGDANMHGPLAALLKRKGSLVSGSKEPASPTQQQKNQAVLVGNTQPALPARPSPNMANVKGPEQVVLPHNGTPMAAQAAPTTVVRQVNSPNLRLPLPGQALPPPHAQVVPSIRATVSMTGSGQPNVQVQNAVPVSQPNGQLTVQTVAALPGSNPQVSILPQTVPASVAQINQAPSTVATAIPPVTAAIPNLSVAQSPQLPVVTNQVTTQPNLALATNIPGQPNVLFVQAAPNMAGQNPAVPLTQPIQQASAVYPTAIHQALLGNVQVPCSSNVTQSPTVPAQNVSAAPLPMGIVFQTKNAGIPSTVILTQVPQQLPVGQTAPIQVSGTNLSGNTFIVGQVNMAPGQILQPQAANDISKSGSIVRQLLLPKPERHDSNQRLILPKPPPSTAGQSSFSSVANVQIPPQQASPQPSGKNALPPLPTSPEPSKTLDRGANPAQKVAVPNNPDRVICSQVEVAKDVIGPNTGMHEDERRIEVIENHSRKTLEDKIASSSTFHQSGTAPADSINQSQTSNPLPVNSVDQSGTSGKEAVNQSGEGTKLPQESVDLSAEKHSGLSNGPTKVAPGTNDLDVPLVNGVSDSEKEDEKMQITEGKEVAMKDKKTALAAAQSNSTNIPNHNSMQRNELLPNGEIRVEETMNGSISVEKASGNVNHGPSVNGMASEDKQTCHANGNSVGIANSVLSPSHNAQNSLVNNRTSLPNSLPSGVAQNVVPNTSPTPTNPASTPEDLHSKKAQKRPLENDVLTRGVANKVGMRIVTDQRLKMEAAAQNSTVSIQGNSPSLQGNVVKAGENSAFVPGSAVSSQSQSLRLPTPGGTSQVVPPSSPQGSAEGGATQNTAAGEQRRKSGNFICLWYNCESWFDTPNQVFVHAVRAHVLPSNKGQCLWEGCEPIKRQPWSLISHLQDKHCSKEALQVALQVFQQRQTSGARAPTPQGPPREIQCPPNAAFLAIRRMTPYQTPQKDWEEKEGPITKSVRLTATLILRNVAKHSIEGRRKIQRYEEHLSYLALSNLESANFVAKCLGFVFQPEQPESQRDNPPYVR